MTFGQKIQSYRKDKHLSQDALASMLYVTRQSVSQWENDKTMPSVDLLIKLSEIFDVSVDRLLGKDEVAEIAEPIASATVLKDKRQIRRALSNELISSPVILIAIAVGIMIDVITNFSIYPTAFEGINYHFDYTNYLVLLICQIFLVLIATGLLIFREAIIRKTQKFYRGNSGSTKIDFFEDYFSIETCQNMPLSFYYNQLKRVFETEHYIIICMDNGQRICINKSQISGGQEKIANLLSNCKKYRRKFILRGKAKNISDSGRKAIVIISNILFVFAIFAVEIMPIIKAILLTNYKLSDIAGWILVLAPYAVCAAALVFGLVLTIKKIKALRVMIAGAVTLLLLLLLTTFRMPVYNFNMYRLMPEEFVKTMESHGLTVTDTSYGRTERMLWDCYTATPEDKSFEIQYFNFIDDSSSDGFIYAAEFFRNCKINTKLFARDIKHDNFLELNYNSMYTAETDETYCYISLNKYTVIYIMTDIENKDKITEVFEDYQMEMPY